MILWVIAVIGWCCGFLVLWHINTCAGRDTADTKDHDTVSVIVPARNEAQALPTLLESLRQQERPADQILVVDDGSTDGTADVARRHGADVIEPGPLPPGWRGKTWACHRGAAQATGDVLVFLDADTSLTHNSLGRMLASLEPGASAISICPYQDVPALHEQFSAFFVLMMAAGVGAFAAPRLRRGAAMFGQVLLIRRSGYDRAGGHAAVKGQTLENFFMARGLRSAGIPFRCYGGRGTVNVRMYPDGIAQLIGGWSKAFVSGAAATPPALMGLAVTWLVCAMLTGIEMLAAPWIHPPLCNWGWLVAYLAFAGQILMQLRRLGSFHWVTALFYPVPLLFYMGVFATAAVKRRAGVQADWKGRAIDA